MGYNPSYKWTNPTYPIYNQGYNPLTSANPSPSIPGTQATLAKSCAPNSEIQQVLISSNRHRSPDDPQRLGNAIHLAMMKTWWLFDGCGDKHDDSLTIWLISYWWLTYDDSGLNTMNISMHVNIHGYWWLMMAAYCWGISYDWWLTMIGYWWYGWFLTVDSTQ